MHTGAYILSAVKFDNPTQLGASTVYLIWRDVDSEAKIVGKDNA